MRKKLLILVVIGLFSGCQGFVTQDHLIDNYYLVAVDDGIQTDLSYCPPDEDGCSPVIPYTVFAVGYNESYMIVKQHPNYDKRIVNYYILSVKDAKKWAGRDTVIMPLSLEKFEKQSKELNIEKLRFTKIYKDLE